MDADSVNNWFPCVLVSLLFGLASAGDPPGLTDADAESSDVASIVSALKQSPSIWDSIRTRSENESGKANFAAEVAIAWAPHCPEAQIATVGSVLICAGYLSEAQLMFRSRADTALVISSSSLVPTKARMEWLVPILRDRDSSAVVRTVESSLLGRDETLELYAHLFRASSYSLAYANRLAIRLQTWRKTPFDSRLLVQSAASQQPEQRHLVRQILQVLRRTGRRSDLSCILALVRRGSSPLIDLHSLLVEECERGVTARETRLLVEARDIDSRLRSAALESAAVSGSLEAFKALWLAPETADSNSGLARLLAGISLKDARRYVSWGRSQSEQRVSKLVSLSRRAALLEARDR